MHIVDKKLRNGFKFHHEMSIDGVSASLLYSRPTSFYDTRSPTNQQRGVMEDSMRPSKCTGLDPGKKNIITMVDGDRISLKYTTSQRNFESRLTRYKLVLSKERKKFGITLIGNLRYLYVTIILCTVSMM